jgi:hypothetical protein
MMKRLDMPLLRRAATSRLASFAVCAAALVAVPASAADKAKAAPQPVKDKTPVMSPAQLRDCLAQKDRLHKDTDAAVKSKAGVDAMKAEIDSTGDALSSEGTTLDKSDADAVAAYNARVEARNGLVDSWKAKVADYNKEAEGVLATKDAYAKGCENRRYDDRDLNDLQRKK